MNNQQEQMERYKANREAINKGQMPFVEPTKQKKLADLDAEILKQSRIRDTFVQALREAEATGNLLRCEALNLSVKQHSDEVDRLVLESALITKDISTADDLNKSSGNAASQLASEVKDLAANINKTPEEIAAEKQAEALAQQGLPTSVTAEGQADAAEADAAEADAGEAGN